MRWSRTKAGAAVAALVVGVAGGAAHAAPQTTGLATAYQIGVDHSGLQNEASLVPPLARRWVATLPGNASYPLIAAGKVFVTAPSSTAVGSTLYALDQATGSVSWSQSIPGTYGFSEAAYDNGSVFVVDFDGVLRAFDATTGSLSWSVQLPGQSSFTSPPTAANGVVYVGGAGSGGTLYAVDEATGALLSTQAVQNGDHSAPALSRSSVFVSYACDQAYAFGTSTLVPVWHYSTGCEGGGGKTVVAAGGRVYTRDATQGNLVLDAATGTLLFSFTPPGTTALAPAVDAGSVYTLSWSAPSVPVLSAQSAADGSTLWTFTGDGQLDTAPILLATAGGELVVEGSATGALSVLDASTGAQVWSTNVGAPISRPDEQNAADLTGLAAGQGLLVVPAGNTVSAYAHPAPTIASFAPTSGPAGTTVTIAGANLTGTSAVSFNGTAASSFTTVDDGDVTATVPAGATSGPISITTLGGTATSGGVFTVLVPDFAIAAAPASQVVGPGGSASYTITVSPTGGFNGSVSLAVSGLPAGATASFNPVSTTGTSTLTVTVARNAKPATGTLTITGTAGSLVHSTTVALQIRKK